MKVAFYKGKKRLFNRLTAWWLRGLYSHCELVLGYEADGRAICVSSSFLDGGVRQKVMHLTPDHWDLVEVGGDVDAARAWFASHQGDGYDVLGVLGFIARVLGEERSKWSCAEAVAAMLGIPQSWRFEPCSLWAALVGLIRNRLARHTPTAAPAAFFTPEGKA